MCGRFIKTLQFGYPICRRSEVSEGLARVSDWLTVSGDEACSGRSWGSWEFSGWWRRSRGPRRVCPVNSGGRLCHPWQQRREPGQGHHHHCSVVGVARESPGVGVSGREEQAAQCYFWEMGWGLVSSRAVLVLLHIAFQVFASVKLTQTYCCN